MAQVDSENSISMPVDPTRRRFLSVAAGGAVASAIPTAALAAVPAVDPAFALIAEKLATDAAHCASIDAHEKAAKQYGYHSAEHWDAIDNCEAACETANAIEWKLANTPPTTLAGIAAVLHFANKIEDEGGDWPDTDTIGREGWHYQLRATIAQAIETIGRRDA